MREVAQELALAVAVIESTWPDIDYPGVLAYEVAEAVGRGLRAGDQGDDHRAEIAEMLLAFFKPDTQTNVDVNATALGKVLHSALGS